MDNKIKNIVRYLIAVLFLVSAITKITDFKNTILFFENIFEVDYFLVKTGLIILILLELFIVYGFIVKGVNSVNFYKSVAGLLAVFIMTSLYFEIREINNCGCFGASIESSPLLTIIKNILIIAGLIFLVRKEKENGYENK